MSGLPTLRKMAFVVGILLGMIVARVASAHPHAWIDLRTSVVLGTEGRVVAIAQEWLLDDLYSTVLLEDLGTEPAALRAHGADMLKRLKPFSYFTEVRVDDEIVEPGTASEFETQLRKNRFWIRFVMPLSAPVDLSQQAFSYAIFDPTYYVEMLHFEEDGIDVMGAEPGQCQTRIAPPKPTTEAIVRARSVAVDTTPDNSLGALFAERVEVSCQ